MASVTFKAVCISSNRRKDGTYPVKIRVTYKGVSRRLPTNLVAKPSDLTRTLHIKSADILNKSGALIAQMRDSISGLSPFALDGWDVDRVVAHIRDSLSARAFSLDFFSFADGFLAGKAPSTRRVYDAALNSLERYLGRRQLDINDITKRMLVGWMEWTDAQPKTGGTGKPTKKPQKGGQSTRNVSRLAHVYKAAQARYNDDDRTLIPRNPFDNIPRETPKPDGARALSADEMQKVLDAEAEGTERIALDVFILSFATMGANMADLWEARGVGTSWVYARQKTKGRRRDRAEMRVDIQPELAGILARLTGRGPYWLNVLHGFATDKDGCTHKVNRALKSWAKRSGLEDAEHFTFYSARKTWATTARRIGVEKALVDECLTHVGDFPLTDIYAARDFDRMNEANRKVLACLHFRG